FSHEIPFGPVLMIGSLSIYLFPQIKDFILSFFFMI
ncbi:MAG: hypothetical protein ACI9AR_000393, partial [Flavobacteriaceae bacterium]